MRLIPAAAATVASVLLATAGAASATSAGTAASGTASSAVSLVQIAVAGHQVRIGDLTLTSSTAGAARTARIVLTPLTADGTAYGQQVVTPATSPVSTPAVTTAVLPAALGSVLSAQTPVLRVSAATPASGPTSSIAADSLGAVTVLGLPLALQGLVRSGAAVTSAGADSDKQLAIDNLALPSLGAVLAALGLDVRALPVSVLTTVVSRLHLVSAPLAAAQQAVTVAQAQVAAATTGLSAATTGLRAATATLTQLLGSVSIPTYAGLAGPGRAAVEAVHPGTAAAYADYLAKGDAVGFGQAVLAQAQQVLTGAAANVSPAALAVLDSTPLVSVDSLTASTSAVVSTARSGGQRATITGGRIAGLKVLGTDVLLTALGSSTVALSALTGPTLATANAVAAQLSGTLSTVLSAVPGLTLTAPRVDLLTQQTSTAISGGFGQAATALHALTITLPVITLPAALALPGAAGLPAFAGANALGGVLTSDPASVGLLTVSEQSTFRPAVLAAPAVAGGLRPVTATGPVLPYTGPAKGVAGFAVLLLAGAAGLRRRAARP